MQLAAANFTVLRRLAISGTSEVLLAAQYGLAGLLRLVVLKRLRPQVQAAPDFVQTFVAQAQVVAALQHESIATIYDIHQDEQGVYLSMEYLSGEDVSYLIGQIDRGELKMPIGVACCIAQQVADALNYAHSAVGPDGHPLGVTHWDLGPADLLVTYNGICKMLNVGLAKADAQDLYAPPGTLRHKLAYRAPERIQHGEVDHRCDIYSLGVILYELLSGRRLFKEGNEASLVKQVMEYKVSPPSKYNPEVSSELDELVLRALKRDPAQRLPTAREFVDGLQRVLSGPHRATRDDLANWLKTSLSARYKDRQRIERAVGQQALAATTGTGGSIAEVPQLFDYGAGESQLSETRSGSSLSRPLSWVTGQSASRAAPPARSRLLQLGLLASVVTLLLVNVFALAYWAGRKASPDQNADVEEPSAAALWVHITPHGARLSVDGQLRAESVDAAGVLVQVVPASEVTLQASMPGYVERTEVVAAPLRATKEVYIGLARSGEETTGASAPTRNESSKDVPDVVHEPEDESPDLSAAAEPEGTERPRLNLLAWVLLPLVGLLMGGGLGGLVAYRRLSLRIARLRVAAETMAGAESAEATHSQALADELQAELATSQAHASKLQQEVERLTQRLESEGASRAAVATLRERDAKIEEIRREVERSKAEAGRATRDAEHARKEADKWRRQADRAQAAQQDHDGSKPMSKQTQAKYDEMREQLAYTKAEQKSTKAQLTEAKRQLNEATRQLAGTHGVIEDVRRRLKDTEAELERQKQAAEQSSKDAAANGGVAQLDNALQQSRQQLENARKDLAARDSEIAQLKASPPSGNSESDAKAAELQAQLEELHKQLDEQRELVTSRDKELEQRLGELDQLKQEQEQSAVEGAKALGVLEAVEQDAMLDWKQRRTLRMLYEGFAKSTRS